MQARSSVGRVDVVAHLAARVPRRRENDDARSNYNINVLGTFNILSAWRDAAHVVYASTIEVYGVTPPSSPMNEAVATDPATYYGSSKLAGEQLARIFCGAGGCPLAVLRFASLYGAKDDIDRALPNFVRAAVAGDPLEVYGGEELRDFVHIDDAAEAVRLAVERRAAGTYNIGSGSGVSVGEAARLVLERVGSDSEIRLLERRRPAADLLLDISAAARDLNYRPRPFPVGLEDQIEAEKLRHEFPDGWG